MAPMSPLELAYEVALRAARTVHIFVVRITQLARSFHFLPLSQSHSLYLLPVFAYSQAATNNASAFPQQQLK